MDSGDVHQKGEADQPDGRAWTFSRLGVGR